MKKFVGSFVLLFVTVPALFAQDVMVINDKNAEARTVSGFHGIKVSNAFDVIIKQGSEEAVVVSASEEKFRSRIKVNVVNGILQISYDNENVWKWSNENKRLKAYISVKNIDQLEVSGASDMKIDGVLKGINLKIDLSGASSLKADIRYTNVTVDQSGASNSKLSGIVTNLDVDISGASDFTGFDLIAENCRVEASGASDLKITVNKKMKGDASGASDVQYKGTAAISDFRTTGASSLKKRTK